MAASLWKAHARGATAKPSKRATAFAIVSACVAAFVLTTATAAQPVDVEPGQPEPGSEMADMGDDLRFVPTTRPAIPVPQHPPQATTQNVDTDKPPREWQRATDDWGGARPRLDDAGITFNGSITLDAARNLRNGVAPNRQGAGYVANLNVTLDTARLFDWHGGTIFANLQAENGLTHSLDGALQNTSHVYEEERVQLSEIWYEQLLADDRLQLRIGKLDANAQFAVPEGGAEFLNDAAGVMPTVLAMPTDPDPAFGVTAFFRPDADHYLGVGVFDGSTQAGRPTGGRGPASLFDGSDGGAFLIAEAGTQWKLASTLPGRFAVGAWHHTGDFERFDGSTASGASGPYLLLDQMLFRTNPADDDDDRGVGMFLTAGYVDPAVSEATWSVAGGVTWTGIGESRPDDMVGVSLCHVHLSNDAGYRADGELVFEMFYKCRVLKWMTVKPDIQYVLEPADNEKHDAITASVQVVIDL